MLPISPSSLPDQALLAFKGESVFQNPFSRNSLIQQFRMVEGFFSKMTKQMLWGIRVKSKQGLTDRIYKYFDEVNADPVVFHWKYKLDDIDVSEEPHVETLLPA